MDCNLSGSFVHGIFQAKVLEWGAIAFSKHLAKCIVVAKSKRKTEGYTLPFLETKSSSKPAFQYFFFFFLIFNHFFFFINGQIILPGKSRLYCFIFIFNDFYFSNISFYISILLDRLICEPIAFIFYFFFSSSFFF